MKRNQLEDELLKLVVGESTFVKFSGQPPAVRSLMFRLNKKLGIHFACVATNHGHVYQITNKGPIQSNEG